MNKVSHKTPKKHCGPSEEDHSLDRKKRLLSSGAYADVHFLVGEGDEKELLPAHKAFLISASDVFEAMFRFDAEDAAKTNSSAICDTANPPMVVTDVEPGAFQAMLGFIYTGDLSGLNGDNAMAVLYAAKKYAVKGLVNACVDFPISNLSNVFIALTEARFLEEEHFISRCLAYIDKNAEKLLQSEAFLQIDQQLLCKILDYNQLMISDEIVIWKAALRWADEQCRRNGMECSGANRRAMLGPALHKIRFPLVPKEEFSPGIDEVADVYQHHLHQQCSQLLTDGTLLLKIENISEVAKIDEVSSCLSDAVYVRGLPWRILALKRSGSQCFGVFLQCNAKDYDPNWSCECSAMLRIVAQKEGAEDYIRGRIDHTFNAKEKNWGFKQFITLEELMDPSNGWYNDEEDSFQSGEANRD